MKIIFLGDIVGRPGRRAVKELLPVFKEDYSPDYIIANGENTAGGNGITRKTADELFSFGIDMLTMGNHVWDQKEIYDFIDQEERIVRPANYPSGAPGRGYVIKSVGNNTKIGIVNLSGRIFMQPLECPFKILDEIIPEIKKETNIIIVDFHAEATSEKIALAWYVDGRVSAVLGTHTHVQTADERIFPKGTGYITDVGMTGPRDSVIGVKVEPVLSKFISLRPVRFEVAKGPIQLNAVFLEIDSENGITEVIKRLNTTRN